MMQRDYIIRMIEECGAALIRVMELREQRRLTEAVTTIEEACGEALGSLQPMVEVVDAATAVSLVGPFELERLCMYAALLSERAAVELTLQHGVAARTSSRRALEIYAAISLADAHLTDDDRRRIRKLTDTVAPRELAAPFGDEILRLIG